MTHRLSLRFQRWPLGAAPLLLTLALANTSWAQPDLDNGAKADNPANRAPARLRAQGQAQGKMQLAPMTDADMLQRRMRREFQLMGITDATQQDAVTAYIQGESDARANLLDKGRDLNQSLRAATLTNTQVIGLLNTYNAALDDDKARRAAALGKLQKTVDLNKNPKLETYLTLLGLYGDAPAVLNSPMGRQKQVFRGGMNMRVPLTPNAAPGGNATTAVPVPGAAAPNGTVAVRG